MPSTTVRTAFSCSTSGVASDMRLENDCPNLKHIRSFLSCSIFSPLGTARPSSEEAVQLYTPELSSTLSYLHDEHIIRWCANSAYPVRTPSDQNRDIKPNNILLDDQGHAHLTDPDIAVHYLERRMLARVGSMAYMAPEILVKKGHSYTIDWWSLGVHVYELIFSQRPFRGRTSG